MNPYSPPNADGPAPLGNIDLARAVADGTTSMVANLPAFLGGSLIAVGIYYASICTCIGWIAALPFLMWGIYRFALDAVDGKASLQSMLSGTQDFGSVFVRMWGFLMLMVLVYAPSLLLVFAYVFPKAFRGEAIDPVEQMLVTTIPTTLWAMLTARFTVVVFTLVDRDLGVADGISASWELTRGQGLKLAALQLLMVVISLPAQALSVGMQQINGQLANDPSKIFVNLGIQLSLLAVVYAFSFLSGMLSLCTFAAAYRQLAGPSTAPGAREA